MKSFLIPIKQALKNVRSNKGRTLLSLTGIIIGVGAVIIVLSLGEGVKSFVVGQVESFGSDIIQIEPKTPSVSKNSIQNTQGQVGGAKITTFKLKDAEDVGKLPNVKAWYAAQLSQQLATYGGKNKQSMLMGVTAGVMEADQQTQTASGQMFTQQDDDSMNQVAVIGSEVNDSFFGREDAVGKNIKIAGKTFKVIGVLKKRGQTGFFNFDGTIYLPLQTLQKKIMGVDYIQMAVFKLKDMNQLQPTILDAEDIMRRNHNIRKTKDDDFAVNSIQEVKDILDKVFSTINLLLLGLTSISLIVGGVGIMNVMYVSVTERTFEIGLRKAIGARKNDILSQFIFEAIILTLLGGFLGIVFGGLISYAATFVISSLGYPINFIITWYSIVLGFGFSSAIGIIFGYYPALRASQLSPMEALRKE
jgi:putative ABC transport system permease protein